MRNGFIELTKTFVYFVGWYVIINKVKTVFDNEFSTDKKVK